ncbi:MULTISPECIES: DUF928 domain-containing protein [Spirulina sp. CCY15215]|uniref:DUF928 domain-containing protein n=1 Tax=Spirulina sp. CCY15215 TaxID=2767591 RepID=UPI0019510D6F|nr:DUF928 domain-containing protein [Spirulina major]
MTKMIFKNAGLYLGIAFYSLSTFAIMPALSQGKNDDRSNFPSDRVGGGTRSGDDCARSGTQLVLLNPINNLGVTAKKQPLLYIAVPKLDKAHPATFFLRDSEENVVYKTTRAVGRTQEFIGIRLPENILQIGEDYEWEFVIDCGFERDPQENEGEVVEIYVRGMLRQVLPETLVEREPTLEEHLALVQSYQDAGLWSDAIAEAMELRRTYPQNRQVLNQWRELLSALDFSSYDGLLEMLLKIPVPELQVSD